MNIQSLSKCDQVRALHPEDVDQMYELAAGNTIFYQYHPPFATREDLLRDLTALPPGKTLADKQFVGFFDGGKMIAMLDAICGYKEAETVWIGWYILDQSVQGKGVGSALITEILDCYAAAGFQSAALAIDEGNPQSEAFWTKNGFKKEGEPIPNNFSSCATENCAAGSYFYMRMRKSLV